MTSDGDSLADAVAVGDERPKRQAAAGDGRPKRPAMPRKGAVWVRRKRGRRGGRR